MQLTKHHGWGNDFLVVEVSAGRSEGTTPEHSWSERARQWCDRRTGYGADGLLLLDIRRPDELGMRLFNADGGEAEMSGNGIRCLVHAAFRLLHDRSRSEVWPMNFRVETKAGWRDVQVLGPEMNDILELSVDMGPIEEISAPSTWAELGCHADRPVRHLSVGNPHSVVGVDDVSHVDLIALGAKVPHVNLEIVEPGPERNGVTMRVHERGAGLTQACGTGACAVAEAAIAWGLVPASENEVIVHMPGGDARVEFDVRTRRATLIGPAQYEMSITVTE